MHGLTRGGNAGVCPTKRNGRRLLGERTDGGFLGDLRNERVRRISMREMLLKNGLNRLPIPWTEACTAFTIWLATCLSGQKQSTLKMRCRLSVAEISATRAPRSRGGSSINPSPHRAIESVSA